MSASKRSKPPSRAAEKTDFDRWIAAEFARSGEFSALVALVGIQGTTITPLASTYFNLVGADVDWPEITVLFAGSGHDWQGAAFFPTVGPAGGPIDSETAKRRLRDLQTALTENRLVLNDGHFFDKWGRYIKLEEVPLQ